VLAKGTEDANAVDDSGPVCDGVSLEIWYPGYADLGWNGEFSFLTVPSNLVFLTNESVIPFLFITVTTLI
jgi:hypothetical protein